MSTSDDKRTADRPAVRIAQESGSSGEWRDLSTGKMATGLPLSGLGDVEQQACFIVLAGNDIGRRIPLDFETAAIIGRGSHVEIRLSGSDISREHARVERYGKDYIVEDLSSRNGTLVNGKSAKRKTLRFGDTVQIAGSLMVLTPTTPLEDQMREAHRMEAIGRMAGGVVHHFNNLLAVFQSNIEFLQEMHEGEAFDRQASLQVLDEMVMATRRASTITRQLLRFSQRGLLQRESLDVAGLLENVVQAMPMANAIKLKVETERGLSITGDRNQLEQAFRNLCFNAVEAMEEGGQLTLRSNRVVFSQSRRWGDDRVDANEYLLIEVEDQGGGMNNETQRQAFDPFFSTKGGTGLGLSMAYGIVKTHGGSIRVESKEGRGTKIAVLMPLELQDDKEHTTHRAQALPGAALLIGGESPDPAIERVLRAMDLELLHASARDEAVIVYLEKRDRIDLFVVDDTAMGDGTERAVAMLRRVEPALPLIVIGETGFAATSNYAGVNAVFERPLEASRLTRAISRVLASASD